jgi:hypothetical protein
MDKSDKSIYVTSIVDLHLHYGGTILEENGDTLLCPCPFHNEKTPGAFGISKSKNAFNCFGCGSKGGVVEYVRLKENCTVEQAKMSLRSKNLKRVELSGVIESKEKTEEELLEIQTTYNKFYNSLSDEDETGYMIGRGFCKEDFAKYNIKFLNETVSVNKITSDLKRRLNNAGFLTKQEQFIFSAPSVIFTVFNKENAPMYFTNRSCNSPTKLKLKGIEQATYGDVTDTSKPIFVFEGVIDALSFRKLTGCDTNVVAVYGKTSFKKFREEYSFNTVINMIDADGEEDDGDYEKAVGVNDLFIDPVNFCKKYNLPRCKDWNDILCSGFKGFADGDTIDIYKRTIDNEFRKVGIMNALTQEIEMENTTETTDTFIEVIEDETETVKSNGITPFWTYPEREDKHGKISKGDAVLDGRLLGEYLNSRGVWKDGDDENLQTYVYIESKVVKTLINKSVVNDLLKQFFKEDFQTEYKNGFYNKFLKWKADIDRAIRDLDNINIRNQIVKSTSKLNYFFFNNCFVEVSKESGIVCKDYSQLNGLIRKENISPRNFSMEDKQQEPSKFNDFIILTQGGKINEKDGKITMSNEVKQRYIRTRKIIGFILHDFFQESMAKMVYITDQKVQDNKEQRNGGTGKSLIANAIKKMRKTYDIHGSSVNFSNNFMFSNCSSDSKVVNLDDVKANFSVGSLYNLCQKPLTIERKFENKQQTDSPLKYLFSSNFLLNFEISSCAINEDSTRSENKNHDSDIRRMLPIFVSPFFNLRNTPNSVLKTDFFNDDWNEKQWNDFHMFMINCNYLFISSPREEFSDWKSFEYKAYYIKLWAEVKDCLKFYINKTVYNKFKEDEDLKFISLNELECLKSYNDSDSFKKFNYGEGHFIKTLKTHCDLHNYCFVKKDNDIKIFKTRDIYFDFKENKNNEVNNFKTISYTETTDEDDFNSI